MAPLPVHHVLAVGAHPDDVEILCAGTLARFRQSGARVTILTVMNGDKGSFDMPMEETARVRQQECAAAAAMIGAEWRGLGISDGTLVWNSDLHMAMIQALQEVNPDLIITHAPNDYMSDHCETARAVANASFYTVCPQFCAEGRRPAGRVCPVYYMDTISGMGFEPQEFVDISGTLETKLAMYAKHASQHRYLSDRENIDFVDVIQTMGHFRGLQCGVAYAEGFRPYDVWGRRQPARLLP